MVFKRENLNKPSNKTWKLIADYLLYTGIPSINIFLVAISASSLVSPEFSLWSIAISNLAIAMFKGATKFTAEPVVEEPIVVQDEQTT